MKKLVLIIKKIFDYFNLTVNIINKYINYYKLKR
jgi:hypothetical protein